MRAKCFPKFSDRSCLLSARYFGRCWVKRTGPLLALKSVNPLVPGVQKIKILNLTVNRLLIVEIVKKLVYLLLSLVPDAHCSERQGLMG